jgi:hypothetical protein
MCPTFFEKVTHPIVGWTASRTCVNHNKKCTKSSKLLCLTQRGGPQVGDPCT